MLRAARHRAPTLPRRALRVARAGPGTLRGGAPVVLRYTRDMCALAAAVADVDAPGAEGWRAQLRLGFEREPGRTVLSQRSHSGPLRVQKALYPEGPEVCQVIVVHPPGGIAGGDVLDIALDAGVGTRVQLTTPGAAKWYRSSGWRAEATTRIQAGPGSCVEWLPQESIAYDGARATIATRVDLEGNAVFLGWDIMSLGRTAAGERFNCGRLHQSFELARDGRLFWCERSVLDGGSPMLQSGAVLGGAPVFAVMIVAAAPIDNAVLAGCRDCAPSEGEGSITRLPEVLVARYRGASTAAARTYFASLWRLLRPVAIGRVAVPPRIWAT
jgi:urease accessory protein